MECLLRSLSKLAGFRGECGVYLLLTFGSRYQARPVTPAASALPKLIVLRWYGYPTVLSGTFSLLLCRIEVVCIQVFTEVNFIFINCSRNSPGNSGIFLGKILGIFWYLGSMRTECDRNQLHIYSMADRKRLPLLPFVVETHHEILGFSQEK